MSLSSLLLGKPKKVDSELDALFKSNPAPPRSGPIPAATQPPTKKRKIEDVEGPKEKKRAKKLSPSRAKQVAPVPTKNKKTKKAPGPASPTAAESDSDADVDSESDSDDDDDELEAAYLRKAQTKSKPTPPDEDDKESEVEGDVDSASDSDADADPNAPPPTHESLLPSAKRVRVKSTTKKTKFVPENETPAQRDARTLFVGGLPVEVAEKKQLKKQLSRHILSFLPSGKLKIESIRFRSAAFQKPSSGPAGNDKPTKTTPTANDNASEHSKSRAAKWRDDKEGADKEGDKAKEYLTPAQKKKVMFIKGEFHTEGRGVNAYVVLAHSHPSQDGDEPGPPSPYDAALEIARAANQSTFLDVVIRVDVCGGKSSDADDVLGATGDPKLSLFVGNLEFGAQERDVMEFFEGVLAAERGPAPEESTSGRWVQSVRLIRDAETQLGKGFGYVRFADRDCVDEVLSLAKTDDGKKKLKFAKRVLRVQRCRATTGNKPSLPNPTSAKASAASSTRLKPVMTPTTTTLKRGDPTLGSRLAHLGKEERKAAKKADKDRESRRAEKKMRMRMKVKGQPVTPGNAKHAKGSGRPSGKGKDRERVRKVRSGGAGKR
ncbi:RRM domain-containing protein [Mycena chlorophos]|uniref:Nucleolar protein 12 n=1 Tax=Mycena chlorophos TaxID=658473 RepID=A0A8H6RZZ7_MYCCL|nr:RRM domain-containing protein [Mycena chlorophos]